MKKLTIAIAIIMSLLYGITAFAANAHYVNGTPTTSIDSNGNLVVSVKMAGLGPNQGVTITVDAYAKVTYAAINGGGKFPQAANKRTVLGPVTGSGLLFADKNGNITGQITVPAPKAPGDFVVSPGQKLVVADASYTNIKLTDSIPIYVNYVLNDVSKVLVSFK